MWLKAAEKACKWTLSKYFLFNCCFQGQEGTFTFKNVVFKATDS